MLNTNPNIGDVVKHAGQYYAWNGARWVLTNVHNGNVPPSVVGPPGPPGPAGPPGPPSEVPGPPGLPGEKGEKGETGEPGAPGAPGTPGNDGEKGEKGEKGEAGEPGAPGIPGTPGADGEKGEKGEQGERGLQGLQGIQGVQGIPGEKGEKGEQGERGLQGLQGIQGLKGETGNQGLQGAPGVGVPTGGSTGQVLVKTSASDFATAWINPPSSGATPSWYGHAHAAYNNGDAQALLERIYSENSATALQAAHVGTTSIRLIRFYNPAAITVNCLRAFVNNSFTAGQALFKFAIYDEDLQKISADVSMAALASASQSWLAMGSALNVSLVAGKMYYLAIAVESTNTGSPLRCFTPGTAVNIMYNVATPAALNVLRATTFHTATTTAGALPSTISAFGAQTYSLTGAFPAIFLCNS